LRLSPPQVWKVFCAFPHFFLPFPGPPLFFRAVFFSDGHCPLDVLCSLSCQISNSRFPSKLSPFPPFLRWGFPPSFLLVFILLPTFCLSPLPLLVGFFFFRYTFWADFTITVCSPPLPPPRKSFSGFFFAPVTLLSFGWSLCKSDRSYGLIFLTARFPPFPFTLPSPEAPFHLLGAIPFPTPGPVVPPN